jgi:hypothetical protein
MNFLSLPKYVACTFLYCVLALAAIDSVSKANAETMAWAVPGGGFFHISGNWNPQSVPGPSDTALFNLQGQHAIGFSDDTATDAAQISAGEVTFALGGQTYSLLRNTTNINDPGLLVSDGRLIVGPGALGGELSTFTTTVKQGGRIDVGESNAFLNVQETLFVGADSSNGNVYATGGASVSAKRAVVGVHGDENTSLILVSGSGSELNLSSELQLSLYGNGAVGVASGGKFTTPSLSATPVTGRIADVSSFSSGSMFHVQGDALMVTAVPGGSGTARLTAVQGGSIVIDGQLSYDHNAVIDVDGGLLDLGSVTQFGELPSLSVEVIENGTLRVRSDTSAFDLGVTSLDQRATIQIDGVFELDPIGSFVAAPSEPFRSTLTVESITGNGVFAFDQGTLNIGELALGSAPDLRDTLSVGSELTVQSTQADHAFNVVGTSDINAGGELSITRFLANFGGSVINDGNLDIDQSVTTFPGTGEPDVIGLGSSGSFRVSDSTINGGVIATEDSTFEVAGEVVFNETLRTQTAISAAAKSGQGPTLLTLNGGLIPGGGLSDNIIAEISIDADVVFGESGALAIKLDGASKGMHDSVTVSGSVQLDGELSVALMPGYTPQYGDEFEFLNAASISNGFSNVSLPEPGDALEWVTDEVNNGMLRLAPTLTVLPAQLEFDGIDPGDASEPESVVIENTGDSVIQVSGLGFAGSSAADFEVASDNCSATPLDSGQTCSIEVEFQPSTPGGHSAQLLIDIDPLSAPFDVDLIGTTNMLFLDRFSE